jgi:hypothetical protein
MGAGIASRLPAIYFPKNRKRNDLGSIDPSVRLLDCRGVRSLTETVIVRITPA